MKKILFIGIFLGIIPNVFASYEDGTGTQGDPYIVNRCTQFDSMRYSLTSYYKLSNDIYLDSLAGDWDNIKFSIYGTFGLDGAGYTVHNATVTDGTTNNYGGIFCNDYLGTQQFVIKNITFDNIDYTVIGSATSGANGCGLVISIINDGDSLYNVHVINSSGDVTWTGYGKYLAGIVGVVSEDAVVEYCSVTNSTFYESVNLPATAILGGVVGQMESGTSIKYCASIGNSFTTNNSYPQLGGLVGNLNNANMYSAIRNCYVIGNSFYATNTHTSFSAGTGGLVGLLSLSSYIGSSESIHFDSCYVANNYFDASCANYVSTFIGREYYGTAEDTIYINMCYGEVLTGKGTFSKGTAAVVQIGSVSEKTVSEMKTQSTYSGWDFTDIWAISPETQEGYPFLRGLISLLLTSPLAGEVYIAPETVPITWVGNAGSNPEVDVYYSIDGGETYTLIVSDQNSPYDWDFSALDVVSNYVKIKLDMRGITSYSALFSIIDVSKSIEITSPTTLTSLTIGSTITIQVQTFKIDSIDIAWSKDSLLWNPIAEGIAADGTGLDNIDQPWVIPVGVTYPFYIRAKESLPENNYTFDETLTQIGTDIPSQPQICWHTFQVYPVRGYFSYDQSCGWANINHTSVITKLSDMGTSYSYSLSTCSGNCSDELTDSIAQIFTTYSGTDYRINQFYTSSSIHLTYKGREYYFDNADSTIKFNDLLNGIDGVFYADLKPYIDQYYGGYHHGWIGIPTIMQIYNVQQSKVLGGDFPGNQDFESLNDVGFVPQILLYGPSYGHGNLVYRLDAQAQLPAIGDPVKDVVKYLSGDLRRYIFRGIYPKATKHAIEPYKNTFPVE